jgi:NADH-ubiquinone oxidoreductase chain 4
MAHTQKVKKFFFLEPALGLLAVWLLVVLTITVYQNQVYARGLLYFLILVLTVIVLTFLKINGLLYFYIFFELSIAPIFLIILIWGYQRERLFASLSILLYTFIASLPLLFLIIFLNQTRRTRALTLLLINDLVSPQHSMLLTLRLLTAFLVKTPLYLTHMWLPKAHVEAPVYGSIILAAILLKIGTFGLVLLAGASYTASFV